VHLLQAVLDAAQCRHVGAAAIALLDARRECLHVGLQALERAARQRIVDGARDVGEIGAQRRDRILDRARPAQRLDLAGDVGQLPFEAREIRHRRARRLPGRCDGLRRRLFERALARGDLRQHLIDVGLGGLRSNRRGAVARDRLGSGLGGRTPRVQLIEPGIEPGDRVGQRSAARRGLCAGRLGVECLGAEG
jgi:hypothetical protein